MKVIVYLCLVLVAFIVTVGIFIVLLLLQQFQMRLLDRKGGNRNNPKHLIAFTVVEIESLSQIQHPNTIPQPANQRKKLENDLRNHHQHQTPPKRILYMTDKSVTTHVETNRIYDSVKESIKDSKMGGWKILTLSQLKRENSGGRLKQVHGSQEKSQSGIHVSILKSNRRAVSSPKTGQDNWKEGNEEHKYLRKLITNGRLIQKIELEMEDSQEGAFFC